MASSATIRYNPLMKYFTYLAQIGGEQLFGAIHQERAQTIAVILSHVDNDVAADVLSMFPDEMRADIAIKMSQSDTISDMLVKSISDTLMGKVASKGVKLGGVKAVANILKRFR